MVGSSMSIRCDSKISFKYHVYLFLASWKICTEKYIHKVFHSISICPITKDRVDVWVFLNFQLLISSLIQKTHALLCWEAEEMFVPLGLQTQRGSY